MRTHRDRELFNLLSDIKWLLADQWSRNNNEQSPNFKQIRLKHEPKRKYDSITEWSDDQMAEKERSGNC